VEGKSFDSRDGGLEYIPPLPGKGGEWSMPSLPAPKKISWK